MNVRINLLALFLSLVWVCGMQAQTVSVRESPPDESLHKGLFTRLLTVETKRLNGADVKAVQQKLRDLGYSEVGPVDGYWGPASKAALQRFQRSNGIYPWGDFGSLSQQALFSNFARAAPAVNSDLKSPKFILIAHSWLLGGLDSGGLFSPGLETSLTLPGEFGLFQIKSASNLTPGATPITATVVSTPPENNTWYEKMFPWVSFGFPSPTLTQPEAQLPESAVLVSATHNVQPRPFQKVSNLGAAKIALQNYIKPRLKDVEVQDVAFTDSWSVDLDKDGDQDFITVASSPGVAAEDQERQGYYTGIFVARASGGVFTIEMIGEELAAKDSADSEDSYGYRDALASHWVFTTVLDADGDGVYEILVDVSGWENTATILFRFEKGKWIPVLSEGIGV